MHDKAELPSDRAERKKRETKEREEEKRQAEESLRGAMSRCFGTEDGLVVLGWIRKQCLHNEPILGANPISGEIDPYRTLYQAMRLNLYISIRRYLPFKILREVEFNEN